MGIEWILAYLALGAVVGFMAGLLGIGGGGIMVPVLTALFAAQGVETSHLVHLAL
ncbi:sulfite exporter TauE/SafE family protein, partial [Pectobacterium versatile]|nr:sulfite exporter TauE/SafE family protein [Pectobacterium versatile]